MVRWNDACVGVALVAAGVFTGLPAQAAQESGEVLFQTGAVVVSKVYSPARAVSWELVVPAPPEDVWRAWTDPDAMTEWAAPGAEIDLRVGGVWEAHFYPDRPAGERGSDANEIVGLVPGHQLRMRAGAPLEYPTVRAEKTLFTVNLVPVGRWHTLVSVTQEGWQAGEEWDRAFEEMTPRTAFWLSWLHRRFVEGPIDWAAMMGGAEAQDPAPRLDRAALDDPTRPQADRDQDADRKPLDVYEWFGIEPGMKVADLITATGYNTHLLSRVVGPEGHVYSVYGFLADAIKERIGLDSRDWHAQRVEMGGLDNVSAHERVEDLPAGSIDVAIAIRNFHDIEFFGGNREAWVSALARAIRPGGVVGIVDVATDVPGWDEAGHALNENIVVEVFTAAGFEFAGSSDLLTVPDDDHRGPGFDVGRHTVDRYVLKFRKPDSTR